MVEKRPLHTRAFMDNGDDNDDAAAASSSSYENEKAASLWRSRSASKPVMFSRKAKARPVKPPT